ncbi:carbonate dehydratase [Prauserella flavalba]|uniref:Carbonate dehydratase n=1 Tax=Prauserella flavalba TaxID=1477506 RepID=A0A318MDM9_9PSEU|nr:carbonate dehydratase [Prauserella flavalba]
MAAGEAHTLSVDEVASALTTAPGRGLGDAEAAERLAASGPNSLAVTGGPGVVRRLIGQLHNPLIYVLLVAAAVSAALGEGVDAVVIGGVVVVNMLVGYVQESRAQRALEALSRIVPTETTVVRAGVARRLPVEDLVPGDLVRLTAGDRVPADGRIADARLLEADESALTGESEPAAKHTDRLPSGTLLADRANMLYSGTVVARGSGELLVTATGTRTQLGEIQRLVAATEPEATPLTRKLARFARWLTLAIVVVAALTFGVGLARGLPVADMFTAAVALAVGAIPEGLPAAVSIVLAIGVVRMSRRKAVVRHLPAVETLGSTTVICTDKTGTLTENRMTVTALAAGSRGPVLGVREAGAAQDEALRQTLLAGVLCNDAEPRGTADGRRVAAGDPTETALHRSAAGAGLDPVALRDRHLRWDVLPFTSERRLMGTVHTGNVGYVKGAVEEVLARCGSELDARGLRAPVDRVSARHLHGALVDRGLRVLAFARIEPGTGSVAERIERGDLTLLGFQAMQDPPREDAAAAVRACHDAGIEVKMITGDHAGTARSVGAAVSVVEAGPGIPVLTGADLERLHGDRLDAAVGRTALFARVSPEQKLRLVRSLLRQGHVVAMTGDGVNDAPALRQADIGVAMGRGGTDAARQAADMVLVDDRFASIESAVEEGRGVFDNLRKFLAWTLPTNVGEGLVVVAAVLAGVGLPILPVQILWINMTTAVLLGLTMAFEPREPGIMSRPPRPPRQPLLTAGLLRRICLVSALLLGAAFLTYEWELGAGASPDEARTSAVAVFVAVQIAYLISCRTLDATVLTTRLGRNPVLVPSVAAMVGLQLLFTYLPGMNVLFGTAPIGIAAWLRALGIAALAFAVVEADKLLWAVLRRR